MRKIVGVIKVVAAVVGLVLVVLVGQIILPGINPGGIVARAEPTINRLLDFAAVAALGFLAFVLLLQNRLGK